MIFLFAIKVIETPLVSMKQRKEIHNPWLPKKGVRKYHVGRKMNMLAIIIVFLIALEAVAPMYIPSQMKAANVIIGISIM